MFKSVFKLIGFALLILACSDLPRDNVLDPKNEDSYQSPTIVVEAFVNVVYPNDWNRWALQSLLTIENTFGAEVIIAEYHRDITIADSLYDDQYNTAQSTTLFNNLHIRYAAHTPAIPKSVPDIFVNGAEIRITGASSAASVAERLSPIIDNLLKQKNYFTIEPQIKFIQQNQYAISCRIASLGNRSADDLNMRILFIKNKDQDNARRTVIEMMSSALENIDKGEYIEKDFGEKSFSEPPDAALFLLTSSDELNIFQSVRWEF